MPQAVDLAKNEQLKSTYLKQDRSVNIQSYLKKQEQLEKSGLGDIEIRDRVKSLGKDDFLKLLVTQLSHQDPTEPVKDQDFIAQMAQFSSLEQMQNISGSVNRMADREGMNLVGKFVMGKDETTGDPVSGIASAVLFDDQGGVLLRVGNRTVPVADLKMVSDPRYIRQEYGGTGEGLQPANASGSANPPSAAVSGARILPEAPSAGAPSHPKETIAPGGVRPGNGRPESRELKKEEVIEHDRPLQPAPLNEKKSDSVKVEKVENAKQDLSLYEYSMPNRTGHNGYVV